MSLQKEVPQAGQCTALHVYIMICYIFCFAAAFEFALVNSLTEVKPKRLVEKLRNILEKKKKEDSSGAGGTPGGSISAVAGKMNHKLSSSGPSNAFTCKSNLAVCRQSCNADLVEIYDHEISNSPCIVSKRGRADTSRRKKERVVNNLGGDSSRSVCTSCRNKSLGRDPRGQKSSRKNKKEENQNQAR